VRYAHNGDVAIAYQVFGEGPISLVCVPGFISNLYWNWELPEFSRMLTGLGSFARVVILDRRGVGLSDRLYPKDLPPLEVVMDDVVTVMDEAGIERAAVFGWQSGATHAALLAATYPARVTQLVTFNLDPCPLRKPGWTLTSWGRGEWESYLTNLRQGWGIREWVKQHNAEFAPDATSLTFENWALAMFPLSANPATAEAVERLDMETDIRAVLPAIHVPTLVLHRPQAWTMPPEIAAYVADQISSATVVAVPGRDDSPYTGDVDAIVDEVEVFLTGERHGPSLDRILSTVLFTDIAGSTQRLAEVGDAHWANLLAQHDDLARREIERYRGRYVDSTGDGLLATFDGPARAGEILVSATVKDLTAGSGLVFEDAGEHELKGVPDPWHLYRVLN
jgi:pimeloyl-ACP methyl ester carboxylesterase